MEGPFFLTESFLMFWAGLILGLWIGYQSGKHHKKY